MSSNSVLNNEWQTLLVSMHTNHISDSAILSNNYVIFLLSDSCACVQMKKTASQMKPYSSSVTGLKCLVRLQCCEKVLHLCTSQCKLMLFCVKTTVKESRNFQLAVWRRGKKQRKIFGCLANFWFSSSWCFLLPLCMLLVTKTLKDEW